MIPQVGIHQLPSKVLLKIFALVGPEQLLSSVSDVCRRWRRLALDPRLWSRVSLCYEEAADRPWVPETRPEEVSRRQTTALLHSSCTLFHCMPLCYCHTHLHQVETFLRDLCFAIMSTCGDLWSLYVDTLLEKQPWCPTGQ